jgi:hypothetical protein
MARPKRASGVANNAAITTMKGTRRIAEEASTAAHYPATCLINGLPDNLFPRGEVPFPTDAFNYSANARNICANPHMCVFGGECLL